MFVYAYNENDTNYHMYFIDVVVIPKPIEVNDLIEDLNDDEQISLKWSYEALYNVTAFVIVFYDITLSLLGDVLVLNNDIHRTIDENINNISHYTFHLTVNNGTCSIIEFNITDNFLIKIYPHNNYGVSQDSNQIIVNVKIN